jgi:putative spermidine/putrescine transport system permease protein
VLAPGSGTWSALGASVLVAAFVTLVAVAIGLPAGRALGLYRFRGRRIVEFVLLTPVLLPPIAIALGLHGVFLRLGLTGSFLGVVLVHLVPVLPYVVLILSGAFANLDPAYEDQARSLGAGRMAVLRTVTLPSIGPGLATAVLFGFLVSWGQYALTLVIGGGRVVTLPILLFASAAGGDTAITSALALFATLPALVILVVNARAVSDRAAPLGGVR